MAPNNLNRSSPNFNIRGQAIGRAMLAGCSGEIIRMVKSSGGEMTSRYGCIEDWEPQTVQSPGLNGFLEKIFRNIS